VEVEPVSIERLLRLGKGGRQERRKTPRVSCRLQCTLRRGRRSVRARVLDVSEGGLCLLSPVQLQPKQSVLVQIDVPRRGMVEVEAVAWHVRQVKSGRAHKQAWSIGMMITKADPGFASLLPDGSCLDFGSEDDLSAKLAAMAPPGPLGLPGAAAGEEAVLDEDSLSSEQLAELDVDLLSKDEIEMLCAKPTASPDDTLRMFRVRVKAKVGPRTRALTFGAVSAEEAEALARSELDESWNVIEVVPA
jgi:hypothetical protein